MSIIKKALSFEAKKRANLTRSEMIVLVREAKELILEINEVYKKTKESELMDTMKRLTLLKKKYEKRLKGR